MKRLGSSLALDGTAWIDDQWFATLPGEPLFTVSWVATQSIEGATATTPATTTAPAPATLPSDPLFANEWWLQNTGQSGGTPGRISMSCPPGARPPEQASPSSSTIPASTTPIPISRRTTTRPRRRASIRQPTAAIRTIPTGLTGSNIVDLTHGTWVAGLIAAANNDYGIVGVAYNATVSAFRVIDTAADAERPMGQHRGGVDQQREFRRRQQ